MTDTCEEMTSSVRAGGQCLLDGAHSFEEEPMYSGHSLQDFFWKVGIS
jgi:hypothetical protein